jgi:sulfite dehydrogenase
MADRRRRGWTDAGAEALVILIVLGLMAVAAFVGWIAGRATREETTTVTVGSTSSITSTTSTKETTTTSTTTTPTTGTGTTGTGTTVTGTGTTTSGGSPGVGDPVAGRGIFMNNGCGSCHTLEAAGTSGNIGPNLDEANPSLSLVVERVTNGKGAMPSFKGTLSDKQIRDVATFVVNSTGGG